MVLARICGVPDRDGGGDNPYYIRAMYRFFIDNRDVVAFKCCLDKARTSVMANSVYRTKQNPNASAVYAQLW